MLYREITFRSYIIPVDRPHGRCIGMHISRGEGGGGGGGMMSRHSATCSLPLTVGIFGHWCICCVALEWELRQYL